MKSIDIQLFLNSDDSRFEFRMIFDGDIHQSENGIPAIFMDSGFIYEYKHRKLFFFSTFIAHINVVYHVGISGAVCGLSHFTISVFPDHAVSGYLEAELPNLGMYPWHFPELILDILDSRWLGRHVCTLLRNSEKG